MEKRQEMLLEGLKLDGLGLEIAPLFRPNVSKKEHNVLYTDYTSTEELRSKNVNNSALTQFNPDGVVDIDFIWRPDKKLIDCAPAGTQFDYVIASHVIEHVPNTIDWLLQIMEVLKPGGILSLIVPDKRACFDVYRHTTTAADLLDAWFADIKIPSTKQIVDCLMHAVDEPEGKYGMQPLDSAKRLYTDEQALSFAAMSFATGHYLDIHCTVYTPESFVKEFNKLIELGVLNTALSEPRSWLRAEACPTGYPLEFLLQMTKLGEPAFERPVAKLTLAKRLGERPKSSFAKRLYGKLSRILENSS